MKHRLLSSIALAALACAVLVAGAAGGGKGRLYQFRGELLATGTRARTRPSRPGPRPSSSAGRPACRT